MKIELQYFPDCPSWQSALENLRSAIALEALPSTVELVEVLDDEDAATRQFLGSPSILVDGRDLWPESRDAYYMSCRMYRTPEGLRGWPTAEMIRLQLRALATGVA